MASVSLRESELSITAVCTGRNTLSDRAAKIRHSDLFA